MGVRRRLSQGGVSLLVELLLGLALVAIAILAVFDIFPAADRSVALADRTTHAHQLARRIMEETLAKDYDNISVNPADVVEGEVSLQHTKRRGSTYTTEFVYRVDVSLPTSTATPVPEVKDIQVTVRWKYGSSEAARDSFVRLEASKGRAW